MLEANDHAREHNSARITNGVKAPLETVLGHEHIVERILGRRSPPTFYVQVRECQGLHAMSDCDRSERQAIEKAHRCLSTSNAGTLNALAHRRSTS